MANFNDWVANPAVTKSDIEGLLRQTRAWLVVSTRIYMPSGPLQVLLTIRES